MLMKTRFLNFLWKKLRYKKLINVVRLIGEIALNLIELAVAATRQALENRFLEIVNHSKVVSRQSFNRWGRANSLLLFWHTLGQSMFRNSITKSSTRPSYLNCFRKHFSWRLHRSIDREKKRGHEMTPTSLSEVIRAVSGEKCRRRLLTTALKEAGARTAYPDMSMNIDRIASATMTRKRSDHVRLLKPNRFAIAPQSFRIFSKLDYFCPTLNKRFMSLNL
jgi:hypothetical protein